MRKESDHCPYYDEVNPEGVYFCYPNGCTYSKTKPPMAIELNGVRICLDPDSFCYLKMENGAETSSEKPELVG